jgi:WD40 repeat protein
LQNGNFATGSLDATIKIWDPVSEKILSVFDGHTHLVTKIIEMPTSGNLISTSLDRTVNIWDRKTGEIINTLEGFD